MLLHNHRISFVSVAVIWPIDEVLPMFTPSALPFGITLPPLEQPAIFKYMNMRNVMACGVTQHQDAGHTSCPEGFVPHTPLEENSESDRRTSDSVLQSAVWQSQISNAYGTHVQRTNHRAVSL